MPITCEAYNVLFAGKDPRKAVVDLMSRGRTHETEDIVSNDHNAWKNTQLK